MFEKSSKKGQIRFSIKPGNDIKKVCLVGDFNGWKETAMTRQKDGSFVVTVTLRNGTHEYKFLVDGQWRVDPDNNAWALNPFGTLNSVLTVS
ncbi:MAG: glycogen-binding domain-containing protein [Phycisphaerae bacterium]|jgi:1,4-alpha-glucan branching enzyme